MGHLSQSVNQYRYDIFNWRPYFIEISSVFTLSVVSSVSHRTVRLWRFLRLDLFWWLWQLSGLIRDFIECSSIGIRLGLYSLFSNISTILWISWVFLRKQSHSEVKGLTWGRAGLQPCIRPTCCICLPSLDLWGGEGGGVHARKFQGLIQWNLQPLSEEPGFLHLCL